MRFSAFLMPRDRKILIWWINRVRFRIVCTMHTYTARIDPFYERMYGRWYHKTKCGRKRTTTAGVTTIMLQHIITYTCFMVAWQSGYSYRTQWAHIEGVVSLFVFRQRVHVLLLIIRILQYYLLYYIVNAAKIQQFQQRGIFILYFNDLLGHISL